MIFPALYRYVGLWTAEYNVMARPENDSLLRAPLHGAFYVSAYDVLTGMIHRFKSRIQLFFVVLGKFTQHPICQIVFGVRLLSDADFNTRKVVRFEVVDDALDPVVTAVRSFAANAQPGWGERDVVKYNQYVFRRKLIKGGGIAYGFPGIVHECLRFHQKHPCSADRALAAERMKFGTRQRCAQPLADIIQRQKSSIVTCMRIFITGITETADDELDRGRGLTRCRLGFNFSE